jgi:CBS domain-containing protein
MARSHAFPYERARVGDAMSSPIRACASGLPLTEVADLMASSRVHCVVVSSDGPEGGHHGVVTDLDVVRAAAEPGFGERTAGDLASRPAVAVASDLPLPEAATVMAESGATHLLVRDPGSGTPVGVISSFDLLRALAWGQPPRPEA